MDRDFEYEDVPRSAWKYIEILKCRSFPVSSAIRIVKGSELMQSVIDSGFDVPYFVEKNEGLGMIVPENLTVEKVAELVGLDETVNVIDVASQKESFSMSLDEWGHYFNEHPRKKVLNILSLEITNTGLGNMIQRPDIVRHLDWIDFAWPSYLKKSPESYPKVQLYCLMSAKGSYTDFHIDFGGSSVFYHIISGKKYFYVIPPTEENINIYDQWYLRKSESEKFEFLGDLVSDCSVCLIEEGNTLFIPSGWIHAVYTPTDSLVIGGNFIHSLNIEMQLKIFENEEKTMVPSQYRFPMFEALNMFALEYYSKADLKKLCDKELDGLAKLCGHFLEKIFELKKRNQKLKKGRFFPNCDLPSLSQTFSISILEEIERRKSKSNKRQKF